MAFRIHLGSTVVSDLPPTTYITDTFNRGDQANLGTADLGGTWSNDARTSILSNKGRFTNGAGVYAFVYLPDDYGDLDAKIKFRASAVVDWKASLFMRWNGGSEYIDFGYDSFGDVVFIDEYPGGVETSIGSAAKAISAATDYWIRCQAEGTTVRVKMWAASGGEPGAWDVSGTTVITAAGQVGLVANTGAGPATNFDWDDLNAGVIGINSTRVPYRNPMPVLIAQ